MTSRVAMLLLAAAGTVGAAEKPKLSFVKDIVPIFTKSGCANSNCHGSIRGQAGFKLSLFGYEPDLDYDAIVKAQDGRRIDHADPAKSLILLKPTFSMPHGGGERFKIGSLEYEAILDWVRDGATYDSAGSPRLKVLDCSAGRDNPDRHRHAAPAQGHGNIYRRLDRGPDTEGAIHGQ